VRVELHVPGHHIAGHSSDQHPEHADPYSAVADAFRAVRRRLQDHVQRQRDNVKTSAA